MPWNRNDPDPLENRRRQLEEQQRLLTAQSKQLSEQLRQSNDPATIAAKRAEPPVWKMEEDDIPDHIAEPTPARKRHLARQRQRDMVVVIGLVLLLLVVLAIFIWVAYVHNIAPATTA